MYGGRAIARSSQPVRYYVIKCMGGGSLFNAHMAFLPLAVWCSNSIKPTNYFHTLYYFLHNRIPCVPWNILRVWVADYFPPHHILFLSPVSLYNKPYKSKNYPSTLIYYLLSVKWNFVFTLRILVRPTPDQLDCLLQPCMME